MVLSVPLTLSLVPSVKLYAELYDDSLIEPPQPCLANGYLRLYAEHDGSNKEIHNGVCNWEICIVKSATPKTYSLLPKLGPTYTMYCLRKDEHVIAAKIIEATTTKQVGLFLHVTTMMYSETFTVAFVLKSYMRLH